LMGMLIRIKVAIFGRAEAEGIGGKFWTAPAELASEEFRLETHVSLDTIAPNIGKRARNSRNRGWSRQVHLFRSIKSVVSSHKYWESLNGDQEQMSVDRSLPSGDNLGRPSDIGRRVETLGRSNTGSRTFSYSTTVMLGTRLKV
jgi:hypothetical protein